MNELQFYTTLKLGWLNAWIPISALILVQLIFMFVFKEEANELLIHRGINQKTSFTP